MESYNKIEQAYKKEVNGIYEGYIHIEEKVDGSQFRIEIKNGVITCGSHHQDGVTVDSMFRLGVENAKKIFEGMEDSDTTIFCEYLSKPKQNSIPYERTPNHNLIVFDVKSEDKWMSREEKEKFAERFGLDIVPLLWSGEGSEIIDKDNPNKMNDEFRDEMLKKESILGHGKGYDRIEGFVVKNYDKIYDFGEGHSLHGCFMSIKIVNDSFKEKNNEENPNRTNKFQELKDNYRIDTRLHKAVQHCNERGELTGQLSDLKFLVPEVIKDIIEEEKEGIKDALWGIFGKEITTYASKGMPEYYKKYLIDNP